MAPKLRRRLRSEKAAVEEESTLEPTSQIIVVAPDTPLIGFSSPGPSTQALFDDILESNPFPLPELDFLDSQFDATPSIKKVPNANEEPEKASPQPEETAETSPETEPVQKREKRQETKTVSYQRVSDMSFKTQISSPSHHQSASMK